MCNQKMTHQELIICFFTLKLSKMPWSSGTRASPELRSRPTQRAPVTSPAASLAAAATSSCNFTIVSCASKPALAARTFGMTSRASLNACTPSRARPFTSSRKASSAWCANSSKAPAPGMTQSADEEAIICLSNPS